MSQENLEVVQRGFDAFNADDDEGFVAEWHPECELYSVTGSRIDGTPYRGHEGIREYRKEVAEAWTEFRIEPERIVDAGSETVVVVGTLSGRGRGSGVLIEQRIGMVFVVLAGKVRSCRAYPDPQDALEAVGLSE